jgi:glycerate kinase
MRMNSARLGNAVRIVIAPDTFEGSLSAGEAARCLSTGIREARADAEVAVDALSTAEQRPETGGRQPL